MGVAFLLRGTLRTNVTYGTGIFTFDCSICAMKPIILEFIGGYWDGKTLRTDSPDQDEQCLAAACYEMSHHGAIGGKCIELSCDALIFAQRHGWTASEEVDWRNHRYLVAEHRETETEIVVTLKYRPT